MFCEGFERKVAFLDQKNVSSKNHKKLAFCFSKWLVHAFGQKMEIFYSLVFYAKWMRKECLMRAQKEKKPF